MNKPEESTAVPMPSCYWDMILERQMCPKHQVPVAECPIDIIDPKFQDRIRPTIGEFEKAKLHGQPITFVSDLKSGSCSTLGPRGEIPQDKPSEGGSFDVNHYAVYCKTCDHPSLWHWTSTQDHSEDTKVDPKEGCRGFGCQCHYHNPGDPVPISCDLCGHPIRWHDKAGPRCTAFNCPCGRTAA